MTANIVAEARSGSKLVWFAGIASIAACAVYWARSRRESRWTKATRKVQEFMSAQQRELKPHLRAVAEAATHGDKEVTKAVAAGGKKISSGPHDMQRRTARLLATTLALMEGVCVMVKYGQHYGRARR